MQLHKMSRLVSTADADPDYTDVELVYCRDGFSIMQQQRRHQRQDLTTTITTLDAGVIASLLDAAFRGSCAVEFRLQRHFLSEIS